MKLSMDEKNLNSKMGETKKRHLHFSPTSFFYKNERFERFFTSDSKLALSVKEEDRRSNQTDLVKSRKSIRGNDDDKRSQ